jgi:hypothetical protein
MSESVAQPVASTSPATRHSDRRRKMLILIAVVGVLVLLPIACVSMLAITSQCGFRAEWNALAYGAPRVPIPDAAVILSQRDTGERPLESGDGSGFRAYGELYHVADAQETIVAFYQQRGATCVPVGRTSISYWHCDFQLRDGGEGGIDIFDATPTLVLPQTNRLTDYHLIAPLPQAGTILRALIVWCDDV